MTTTINADTSTGGAIVTGDASGVLGLQAAGVTKVTINSSGVTLANPLPVASGGTGATSLSGLTVGTATSATTATNLASGSAGTVPYQSASGTTAMLAAGSSGQLLQSNGAAAPSWVAPSTGSMVFLSSSTAYLSSYVDFTGFVTSTYSEYLLVVNNFFLYSPASYGAIQLYINGTLSTTGYGSCGYYTDNGGSGLVSRTQYNETHLRITNGTNVGLMGAVQINANYDNGLSGNGQPTILSNFGGGASAISTQYNTAGLRNNTGQVTGIRILPQGGGSLDGYFYLYGIKKS
jgi:hypothetical protein